MALAPGARCLVGRALGTGMRWATLTYRRQVLGQSRFRASCNCRLLFPGGKNGAHIRLETNRVGKPLATSESIGSTSSSLVGRAKTHEQEAWTRLVRLYGPLVALWLRQGRLQPADANDVFQAVFVPVAKGIGQFHKDRPGDSFRGWLRVIVRNQLADHFRQRRGQPVAVGGSEAHRQIQELADPGEEPQDAPDEASAVRQLRLRALEMIRAEFEDRTWQAFWRVTVDGQSPKEVAQELGVTPSAVRLAKSRVLRRLREEQGDLES